MKLQPALVFGSHMVLQRREPIAVWGKAAADDTVTVTLGSDSVSAKVKRGSWKVELPAREAATDLTMTIAAAKTGEVITYIDVAVGEVWLAGGQSNMEFLLKYDIEAPEVIPAANDPLLRCFDYPETSSPMALEIGRFEDYGFWRTWNPDDAPWFCAVGYWFAAQLRKALDVPVGILACNWGGTPANSWTSLETLQADPVFAPILERYDSEKSQLNWETYLNTHVATVTADPAHMRVISDIMMMGGDFSDLLAMMPKPAEGEDAPKFEPPVMLNGPYSQNAPGCLYENMLKQVAPYGVRGVIWYQGETDADDGAYSYADFYDASLKAMRSDWSKLWGKELPLMQVMLAPFDHWLQVKAVHYPELRSKQMELAATDPHFYVANIMDHGDVDNIHPRDKRHAGERLSLLARKHIYGEDILADAPVMRSVEWSAGKAVVCFDHAEGLHCTGETVDCLELLNNDVPVDVSAAIEGETLVLTGEGIVPGAMTLKFAWQNYCIVNCCNAAGLPVCPFCAEG